MPESRDSDQDSDVADIFQEPDGFYQPDKPASFTKHTLKDGQVISLRLVGHSPLWGHLLWNAAQVITSFLDEHAQSYIRGKTVLELGAGAGLPSLVCAIRGASTVVVTDYPDADLVANLQYNVDHAGVTVDRNKIVVKGYLWGNPTQDLKACLQPDADGFDVLILADILFNHSEHVKLVDTLAQSLSKKAGSAALVFFTPYRPWLLERDLAFFDLARDRGFAVTKILEHTMDKVMFDEDPGDELLRRTVFGYQVTWSVL